MPQNENVITLRFTDRAAAYQALSGLKYLNAANAEVRGAVLIERLEGGAVRVTEGVHGVAGRDAGADVCLAQAPTDGAVVLADVCEVGTDTMDMLALWYGAVLKRLPAADSVRGGLQAVAGAADGIADREGAGRRDGGRAEVVGRSSDGVAVLRRMSAA
ncbi:hypothetical protein [Streptomyces sp. A012304]|uniref:hypothetical protein n=1 Tax=Streptomyces sp. A012304 TaxID=375446 RepID=UPI0022309264|nr:hypothetical protein [Streptomyces sp. A012304]GKQ39200.1 hypothetical protein ALMP_57290 [Streptomyces sp. A012304]